MRKLILGAAVLGALIIPSSASANFFYNHWLVRQDTYQLNHNSGWAGLPCGYEFVIGPGGYADVRGQQWYRWSIRTAFGYDHFHGYVANENDGATTGQLVWTGVPDVWQGGLDGVVHPNMVAQSYRNVDGTPWVRFYNQSSTYSVQIRKRCI